MPNSAKVKAIIDHLLYELGMLWGAGASMQLGRPRVIQYCLVEAFALHARNVVDFFYDDAASGDDVAARHFFSRPKDWPAVRPAITAVLSRAKARANKEISHLTYARLRVAPKDKPWPVGDIVRDLDPVLNVFCEKADLLPDAVKLLRYRKLLP